MSSYNPLRSLLASRSTLVRRSLAIAAFLVVAIACFVWATGAPAQAGPYRVPAGVLEPGHLEPHDSSGGKTARRSTPAPAEDQDEPLTVKGKILRGKLNLNTATEEQLQMLPGIGEAKARRIVEDRQKRGKFQRVRDLKRVKGIGYKTLKKLTPYLAVDGETTLQLE